MRTKPDVLSATDRARLREMRGELKVLLGAMDFTVELFSASATVYRERTGQELDIRDPAAHLTEADKLRALELFRASRSRPGEVGQNPKAAWPALRDTGRTSLQWIWRDLKASLSSDKDEAVRSPVKECPENEPVPEKSDDAPSRNTRADAGTE